MIKAVKGKAPIIDDTCFIAENATIVGDVTIGENTNIWYSVAISKRHGYYYHRKKY